MINIIKSLFNINKKLYIIINDNVSKGKIARVCCTIGQKNPNYLFSSVIVVKTKTIDEILWSLENYKDSIHTPKFMNNIGKYKISGKHIDAGYTQCKFGTLLAVGVAVNRKNKIDLPLY